MPFIALSSTGERIDITKRRALDIKNEYAPGDLICQNCGGTLHVREAHMRLNHPVSQHFYHAVECNPQYDAHPESAQHLWGKVYVREHLMYNIIPAAEIELEQVVLMPWRARGRIADILVTYTMGWRDAHEIQLAPITPDEIEERHYDYLRAGVGCYWWLGGSAQTPSNTQRVTELVGWCHILKFSNTK